MNERAKSIKDLVFNVIWIVAAIIILATTLPMLYIPWLSGEKSFDFMLNIVLPAVLFAALMFPTMIGLFKNIMGGAVGGQNGVMGVVIGLIIGVLISLAAGAFIGPFIAVYYLIKKVIAIIDTVKELRVTSTPENEEETEK